MKESYLSVKKPAESEIVIEKSRFICSVSPVNGEEDAKNFVSEVKAKHKTATHNCYAYIADENGFYIKFSDDGEPQGTAGMPMLEVLKNKKLFKVATVVTRYFGGIKLGAGGLVRAYSDSVCSGLNSAGIVEYIKSNVVEIEVGFSLYSKILKYFETIIVNVNSTNFTSDGAVINFTIPSSNLSSVSASILDLSSGKINTKNLLETYEIFNKKYENYN